MAMTTSPKTNVPNGMPWFSGAIGGASSAGTPSGPGRAVKKSAFVVGSPGIGPGSFGDGVGPVLPIGVVGCSGGPMGRVGCSG